jgi:hypothetical protein
MLKRVDANVHAGLNLVDDDRNPTNNTLLERSVSGGSSYEDRDCLAVQLSTSDGLLGSCAPEQTLNYGGRSRLLGSEWGSRVNPKMDPVCPNLVVSDRSDVNTPICRNQGLREPPQIGFRHASYELGNLDKRYRDFSPIDRLPPCDASSLRLLNHMKRHIAG